MNTVKWAPSNDADIASYEVQACATVNGTYLVVGTVTHAIPSANYDANEGVFFFEHAAGTVTTWYRVVAIDAESQRSSPSTPFQASYNLSLSLVSLADLKTYLSVAHTTDDALLVRLALAASAWFQSKVGRNILAANYVEVRNGDGGKVLVPRHYPVVSVSALTVDGVAITGAPSVTEYGYVIDGNVVRIRGTQAFTAGVQNVSLSYRAGYETVPADVVQAVLYMAGVWFRERTRLGELSKSAAGESISFVQFAIPANVQTVIDAYKRSAY